MKKIILFVTIILLLSTLVIPISASPTETVYAIPNEDIEDLERLIEGFKTPKYLLEIDNPDPDYKTYPIELTDYDRDVLAHLVMGEFGTGGVTGCALIAQSVRDAMVKFDYDSVEEVRVEMGYTGWYSGEPNEDVYEAIDYIFDQGRAAVQHEILVMYATQVLYSSWHEAQEFVVEYESVRFFDY